eukprot:TRINITY_DN84876_c0_g1_i1.p1 TRINITY_DN84876_c0_g1~~TRINITY_DN84876_c0_g1_i1.p1  ORF type:complete len:224 (+),score=34.19 TRINITY_DN84876_c0_g1_i1:72-743(+)
MWTGRRLFSTAAGRVGASTGSTWRATTVFSASTARRSIVNTSEIFHCRRLAVASSATSPVAPRLLGQCSRRSFAASAETTTGEGQAKLTLESLEKRIAALEAKAAEQTAKIEQVETVAKKKGGLMQMITQYGAPFALWYAFCWFGGWFSIYMLLETGIVSWQDSLRPFFAGLGLESYCERVDPSMGNAVIAFICNEILEPVRFPFVLATGVPVIQAIRKARGA